MSNAWIVTQPISQLLASLPPSLQLMWLFKEGQMESYLHRVLLLSSILAQLLMDVKYVKISMEPAPSVVPNALLNL